MLDLLLKRELFNDAYYPYLTDYSHRIEVFFGGAGSGKSVFIALKILLKALNDKRDILIVRKTLNSVDKSTWKQVLSVLSLWHIYEYCTINKSTHTIRLPSDSMMYFIGIDDPERIKSIVDIGDVWCEEATELNEEDFNQLNLRLRARVENSLIFVSFNPVSKSNWVYRRWFAPNKTDNGSFILKTTYKDNKFLPESYIKSLEEFIDIDRAYYNTYVLGEFSTLDKLVYTNWVVEDFDFKLIDGEVITGLDFGYANDLTALVSSVVKDKDMYIYCDYTCKGKTNEEIATEIKKLFLHKNIIIADCAEPKSIEELRRAGITRIRESKKGKDSILHGILRLQGYRMHVHPECTNVINELNNYTWVKNKQTDEYTNRPIDLFNHSLDALRYSILALADNRVHIFSKSILGI